MIFAARWSGYLAIQTAGTYLFALTSDDGSMLSVDRHPLVHNDGLHSMKTKAGQRLLIVNI